MSFEMVINRNNYEIYFLDYMEGRLEENLLPEFRLFLEKNPDLADQLKGMDKMILSVGNSQLPDKAKLKKKIVPVMGIDEDTIDEYLVAELESELTSEDKSDLERFLAINPAFHYDRSIYQKTILQPDEQVIFPAKNNLKKRTFYIISGRTAWISSLAAALLILVLAWRIYFPGSSKINDSPVVMRSSQRATHSSFQMASLSSKGIELPRAAEKIQPRAVTPIHRERPVLANLDPVPGQEVESVAQSEPPVISIDFIPDPMIEEPQAELAVEGSRNLLGKIVYRLGNKNREKRQEKEADSPTRERNVNFWSFASLGVQGYNKLTDRDIEMEVVKNYDGTPKGYSFVEDGHVILSRDLSKE